MELDIIFEDDYLIAINKPNKLLVHHSHYSRNIRETSLAQLVRKYLNAKVHPLHRLDRKTSGLILFAKDVESCKTLQEQFFSNEVKKSYTALVRGHVTENLVIDSPIKNDDSGEYQEAESHLSPIQTIEYKKGVVPYPTSRYSMVKLSPITGRTHQLRKHMNKVAHPIIGDPKHGNRHHNHAFEEWFGHSNLYLHAHEIAFTHPQTSEKMMFSADFPDFWKRDLNELGFKTVLNNNQTLMD